MTPRVIATIPIVPSQAPPALAQETTVRLADATGDGLSAEIALPVGPIAPQETVALPADGTRVHPARARRLRRGAQRLDFAAAGRRRAGGEMKRTIVAASLLSASLAVAGSASAEPMSVTLRNLANVSLLVSGPWGDPRSFGVLNTTVAENSSVTYTILYDDAVRPTVCQITLNLAFDAIARRSICQYAAHPGSTPLRCRVSIGGNYTAQCNATIEAYAP